jgi:hypothetical protein
MRYFTLGRALRHPAPLLRGDMTPKRNGPVI